MNEIDNKKFKIFIFLGALLVILNFLDGMFTYIGLRHSIIEEANPLLVNLEPLYLFTLKTAFSLILATLLFVPKYIPFKKVIFYVFLFANIVYLFILFLHISWITQFLKTYQVFSIIL